MLKIGPMMLLFLIFMVLRLTDQIAWSWWWVTLPLWGGFLAGAVGVLIWLVVSDSPAARLARLRCRK